MIRDPGEGPFVGRGPVTVEEAGAGEERGAGAHRGHSSRAFANDPERREESGGGPRDACLSRREKDDVERRAIDERRFDDGERALVPADGTEAFADDEDFDLVVEQTKHFERAEEIEEFEFCEGESGDSEFFRYGCAEDNGRKNRNVGRG